MRTDKSVDTPSSGVKDALYAYYAQEARYAARNPGAEADPVNRQLQYRFLSDLERSYRKSRSVQDRTGRAYIRMQLRRLRMLLEPRPLANLRLWFINLREAAVRLITSRPDLTRVFREFQTEQRRAENLSIMTAQLRETGFQVSLDGPLQRMQSHGLPAFHIRHTEPNAPGIEYVLHFDRVGKDLYQFTRYDLEARHRRQAAAPDAPVRPSQPLTIQVDQRLNTQEAIALLRGQPVFKDIDGQRQWWHRGDGQSLQPHAQSAAFDLNRALAQWPIKELRNPAQATVVRETLQRGGVKVVTVQEKGREVRYSVSVAPDLQGLIFRNTSGQVVTPEAQPSITHDHLRARKLEPIRPNVDLRHQRHHL